MTATVATKRTKSILSVMEPNRRYRLYDLILLTGLPYKQVCQRVANLKDQGRVRVSIQTTRKGHLFLYERAE